MTKVTIKSTGQEARVLYTRVEAGARVYALADLATGDVIYNGSFITWDESQLIPAKAQ